MKERPILFSGPMVRAILGGRKTQTRRVVKPQPRQHIGYPAPYAEHKGAGHWHWYFDDCAGKHVPLYDAAHDCVQSVNCPYGQPGDRLWVKETWRTVSVFDHCKSAHLVEGVPIEYIAAGWREGFGGQEKGKTRVSLFMRRWMSRITLEIVSVRVERLDDISEADAIAEGIGRDTTGVGWASYMPGRPTNGRVTGLSATDSYRTLWESINGPGSWEQNPWVWVLTFRRVAP